jgi:hypothetical protein
VWDDGDPVTRRRRTHCREPLTEPHSLGVGPLASQLSALSDFPSASGASYREAECGSAHRPVVIAKLEPELAG